MLGVTFGSKHSYNDWGIWLEDTHINPPLPKRYIVDVPARNGLLDLTPELTPTIRFENRTLTLTFRVKAGDWSTLVSQIYGQIHGQTLDVISDLDPQWHWHGCVTVDDFSSDQRTGKLVITVDADPFKLSNTENSYTVNGNGTITCVVDRMEISPAFELTAPTTVIYGDSSYTIESTATTEKTLSGEIVSFADGTANPAVDLTADIDAVQDLHGYDHPWVGGAGKNKIFLRTTDSTQTLNGITASYNANTEKLTFSGTNTNTSAYILWMSSADSGVGIFSETPVNGVTYYVSGTLPTGVYANIVYKDTSNNMQNTVSLVGNGSFKTQAVTFTNYMSFVRVQIGVLGSATSVSGTTGLMFSTEQPSAWEPYSNICPISGWDEVNVWVDPKYGGFINWNQLANYSTNTSAGITKVVDSNGVMSLNGTATGNVNILEKIQHISGHKYIFLFEVVANPNNLSFTIGMSQGSPWINDVTDSRYIIYTSIYGAYFGLYNVTNKNLTGLKLRTMISDLTQIFGEGNEPTTVEEFKALFPNDYYAYNTGEETCVCAVNGESYGYYTIDLDGTRYGGTLDVTTGVLTLTHGFKIYDGTETWGAEFTTNFYSPSGRGVSSVYISGDKLWCSHAPSLVASASVSYLNCYISTTGNFNIQIPNSIVPHTATDMKSWVTAQYNNGTPLTIRYELATPQTVQLTAEQVTTLKNQNNIWADSGEVEVTYIAQDFAGRKFFIPDLELTEGSHSLTIQGTGTTKVTYTNGRL